VKVVTETQYSQYFIAGPLKTFSHCTSPSFLSHEGKPNAGISISYHFLADNPFKAEHPHKHNLHELLCFISANPTDNQDFDAEAEPTFGLKQEKHLITSSMVTSIPPGLIHCPSLVKRCIRLK
jgi:hypothetical protein